MENGERCGLCAKPIRPGDKATLRRVADKGVVRVHNVCYAKASMGHRIHRRKRSCYASTSGNGGDISDRSSTSPARSRQRA